MKKYELSASELIDGSRGLPLAVLVFKLKENVVSENLDRAVTEAIELHPLYKTRLVSSDGVFELVENDLEPVVKERKSDRMIELSTEELNYYPWHVFYRENEVALCASHTISDAYGSLNFMKTVLRLYFEKSGILFQNDGKRQSGKTDLRL